MTQAELLTQLATRLQDNTPTPYLNPAARLELLQNAVVEYSKYRPQQMIDEQVGNNTIYLRLPTDWDAVSSRVQALEEVDQQDHVVMFPADDYVVYRDKTQTYLRLAYESVSQYTYRLRYTKPHTLTTESCSVPTADTSAILDMAASEGCLRLAAATIPNFDNTMSGAIVTRKSQAQEYRDLAAQYFQRWLRVMGLPKDPIQGGVMTQATMHYTNPRRIFRR